jgi:hypothetical protein
MMTNRSGDDRSKVVPWLCGLLLLIYVGCGGGSTPAPGSGNTSTPGGGSSGSLGALGESSSSSGGDLSASSGSTGSASGGTSASSSGATPPSSSDGGGGGGAESGTLSTAADAGSGTSAPAEAGVALGNCMPADITPCGSYSTPASDGGVDTIQLGPYGAQADVNVGTGFENNVQSSDQSGSLTCQLFAGLFNESMALTNELLQTTKNGLTINFALYSAYRPVTWPSTPVPVITWGDGTCAQPEGYGALLRYVASYGYFVIAANSREVGTNNSDGSQPMLKALDYAAHANSDPSSPYYQKLDMSKVGAMGHSQGGAATATAASDSRIKYVIDFNASDSNIPKPYLAVSGDSDITNFTVQSMTSAIDGASVPAAFLYYHSPVGAPNDSLKGHLVLMLTPERVTQQTVAWWEMWFRDDAASKADFVGTSCGFCGHGTSATNAYDYGANMALESR